MVFTAKNHWNNQEWSIRIDYDLANLFMNLCVPGAGENNHRITAGRKNFGEIGSEASLTTA